MLLYDLDRIIFHWGKISAAIDRKLIRKTGDDVLCLHMFYALGFIDNEEFGKLLLL